MSYLSNAYIILNEWISNADSRSYKQQIEEHYIDKLYEITGGTVTEEGVFIYEDDPPLEPLIEFHRENESLYVYKYSLVAFVDKDSTFVARVD